MNTTKIDAKQTKMIAHRGVSGLEAENTHLAFVAAGNRSYFGVETDVHVTADGKFILTHDSNTMRVSGEDHVVEQTDFSELRALRLFDTDGSHTREDIRMPSLSEYIGICKKYEKVCVIELKNKMTEEAVAAIVAAVRELEYLEQAVFISFSFSNLEFVRKYSPKQVVQYLVGKELTDEIMANVIEHRFDLDVGFWLLTEERVREIHEAGLLVNCWTVDDPADAERLIAMGVDYITTNILE